MTTSTSQILKSLLVATAALLTNLPALAATLDIGGVKVDDTLTIYNNTLVLNGAGLVSNGKNPQYVAQIYAKQKFTTLNELFAAPGPKRMVITAVREVDTGPIMKLFNRSVDSTASKNDMAKLVPGLVSIGNMFKANRVLRPGEIMTLDWFRFPDWSFISAANCRASPTGNQNSSAPPWVSGWVTHRPTPS